jgi:hypothetical protein
METKQELSQTEEFKQTVKEEANERARKRVVRQRQFPFFIVIIFVFAAGILLAERENNNYYYFFSIISVIGYIILDRRSRDINIEPCVIEKEIANIILEKAEEIKEKKYEITEEIWDLKTNYKTNFLKLKEELKEVEKEEQIIITLQK